MYRIKEFQVMIGVCLGSTPVDRMSRADRGMISRSSQGIEWLTFPSGLARAILPFLISKHHGISADQHHSGQVGWMKRNIMDQVVKWKGFKYIYTGSLEAISNFFFVDCINPNLYDYHLHQVQQSFPFKSAVCQVPFIYITFALVFC
jgi:hypothetical protein